MRVGATTRFLALSLEQKGDLAGAIQALEKAVSVSRGPHYRALLGRAYSLAGQRDRGLSILEELTALAGQGYVSPFDMAMVHLGLDDRASLFRWLEEAFQQRVWRIIELNMPIFDGLRTDVRLQSLVRRIGLDSAVSPQLR